MHGAGHCYRVRIRPNTAIYTVIISRLKTLIMTVLKSNSLTSMVRMILCVNVLQISESLVLP